MTTVNKAGFKIVFPDTPFVLSDCVITLGNFDGMHVAHSALLSTALKQKSMLGASAVGAWCFEYNFSLSSTHSASNIIMSTEDKINLFFNHGMDFVVVADFPFFRDMSADGFITSHLKGELGCIGAACGYDFRFGKNRQGDADLLRERFGQENVEVLDKIELDGLTISSTQIRKFILDGDMEQAQRFLGRPYFIRSEIKKGKQLGTKINFPTANQEFGAGCIIPKFGIYATMCQMPNGQKYIGVSNVGIRPTISGSIDSHKVNCETHIIGFDGDIYGDVVKTEFYKFLRAEKKFSGIEELSLAISHDVECAISYFEQTEVDA